MRLKSIKLAGFKSFVDPTIVHFPSNMCGVVGPNGCGKSNIIDAVRWVMGESSAKHLRGESMTDVIFKGSNSRKPSGQASVELIFDNNEGRIVGEYAAYNEISVKRTLNTDAKNTYFLNGTKCRRRDVMDIFLGTGLGPRSYAIISQGIVSNLIESKPEELRVFIEEAAGISKYKERRRETENRIRRTNENLERLTDLRDELGRQLGHLERQAQAAEKYKEYKAEERLKKAQLHALKWRSIDTGTQSQEQAISELEVQLEAAVSQQRATDAGMEEDRVSQMALSDRFHETQSRYYNTGNEVTRVEQTLRHRVERAQELTDDLQQIERSWQEAREQLEDDQQQLEAFREELVELEPELELLQEQEDGSSDALTRAEAEMHRWQQEWDHFNQRSHEPKRTAEVEQSRITHAEQVVGRLQDREKRLREETAALAGSEDQQELEALAMTLTELELSTETVELRTEECSENIDAHRDRVQNLTDELEQNRDELSTVRGRHASLEALHQAAMHQDVGAQEWIEQQHLTTYPKLVEKLKVEPGWETSVETVLGNSIQAVCLDSLDPVATTLTNFEQGALVLLEADVSSPLKPRLNDLPLLAEKLQAGHEARALLAGVYAAETLEKALTVRTQLYDGESIVTREGIWLSAHWLRVSRGVDNHAGVLERQKEMEVLAEKLITLEDLSDGLKEQLLKARNTLEQQESQRQQLQRQLSDLNRQQGEVRANHSARKVRLEQFAERRRRLEQELRESREQHQIEQEVIGEARLHLQDALDLMEEDIARREQLQEQRERCQSQLETVRHKARHDKERAHQLALRQQSINTHINSIQAAIERLSQQTTKLRERREFLKESLAESNSPEGELKEQLEELLNRRLFEEESMQNARMTLEEVEQRIREGEKIRHNAEQQAQKVRGQLEKLKMDWQSMQVRRTTLAEQLQEDKFDLTTVLENLPGDATENQWEQDLEQLQSRIDRLGAINLAAIEEYETQSERKNYLDAQNTDLESALNTLENAIRKIDKETRQRFKVTFDQVNLGLQALFPRVFGGGQAYLQLTGDDLLDTGVTIMAQPPGKKNSTIHLLSGGEKALTAIALVFAIFQLNPAPFCMLDEVDAPLDDANVGRYAKMVAEMSDKVQFVYITHNKIAMQAASQLVGVTMHEPGVSRPVSVDIEQAAALAEL